MSWNENKWKNYFSLIKFIGLICLTGFNVIYGSGSLVQKSLYAFAGSMFIMFSVMIEWKNEWFVVIMEGILALTAVFLFPAVGNYFAAVWLLDFVTFGKMTAPYYLLGYIVMFLFFKAKANLLFSLCIITFLVILYIQEKIIIQTHVKLIEESEKIEGRLKVDMEKEKKDHNDALRKSRLESENILLEERNRIAQTMHDKLGHSINGSLYQLEAAKLLVEKKPLDCQNILQEVIDQLRISMDEIRIILRRERPDKMRVAVLSLQSLCEECEERYHIKTELSLEGETERIDEVTWEIILDNTFEAVTNALKYADCRKISITIAALNQVVRCSICDDGKGTEHFTEGMGIAGMKKRVRDVHGILNIETEVGFRINMILPTNQKG